MRKIIFLIPLLVAFQAQADIFTCPHGCGTETDPAIEKVGDTLITTLQNIEFLDHHLLTGSKEGNEWALQWKVEKDEELECEDFDVEDDDDDAFEENCYNIYQFDFSSQRLPQGGNWNDNDFSLKDFPSARKIIDQIHEDVEFVFDEQKRESEERISHLKKETADQKLVRRELARIKEHEKDRQRRIQAVEATENKIQSLYEEMLSWCIAHHKWKGSIYSRGLISFEKGDFSEAFDDISSFIAQVKAREQEKFLNADLFFNQGKSASEIGMYQDAIAALSKAIQKNPQFKDAYFERALAYFETGNFDLAFADYLSSNLKSQSHVEKTQDLLTFALGIDLGIRKGGDEALLEFIPSTLASVYGIGQALWAFAQDPIQVTSDFANSAIACMKCLYESSSKELLEMVVPEIKELILKWDELEPLAKGEQTGQIIGKYGIEIFATMGATKAVKAFQDLKRANNLMTFEAQAISKRNKASIAAEATKRAETRKQILKSANLKIQMDKQGKHIIGHRNYDPLVAKSIFEHPEPQRLVNDFAGKGIRIRDVQPGVAGYKEKVDFGEFIGYVVDEKTKKKVPTTWGTIHYAKDGTHIVPTLRRG